eukprot:Tamp_25708.p1 GENE.Tamp_25708~~Tamp_25708.p1  ORF type:complete len:173 (-),score=31.80 Tamp_25708:360-878(-)
MDRINQNEPQQCFKLVAIDDEGRYVSIYDGTTEYKVGETITQEVRAGHKGGFYVCDSILDLLKLGPLPSRSAMIEAPWAVVELVGWGPRIQYNELSGGSKVAITHIVPVKFVDFPNEAKRRFLLRSRRQHATARRQRENGRQMSERAPLALTPEELQTIFQDWQMLVDAFEG